MDKKKIKVKVKKKKLKIRNILLFLLISYILYFFVSNLINKKITNIYVIGNNIISDKEIINLASLNKYPSFLLTTSTSIKKKLLTNEYIKKIEIKKKIFGKIYIYITEQKILYLDKLTNKIVLENGESIDNIYNINKVPTLTNIIIDNIYDKAIESLTKIDSKILLKISEIEYAPVEVDKERFVFYMNDGNSVYINLSKIESINKYEEIYSSLDNKKGIIYLDSGNYFEAKE